MSEEGHSERSTYLTMKTENVSFFLRGNVHLCEKKFEQEVVESKIRTLNDLILEKKKKFLKLSC